MLVINLYIGDSRIFSLAFSFYQYESGEIDAIIGAIQGRKSSNIKEIYHDITKQELLSKVVFDQLNQATA
ncbi:MAG: VirK/YbjX family protein [Candidatus Thiodiazotropha sp. (ex Rostrolucina anterorostrata)]|nr:VirK/YbjX family protein [Candidatus Thiodiazotropha sp. (ex Rostrolucina anterorostrata)]